jgi:DNA-binding MarR family transcriptional regulator
MNIPEAGRTHPRHQLDEALLIPVRLSMMAALRNGSEINFSTLRDLIETDDSALSKATSRLETARYVKVRKGYAENKPRIWVRATRAGLNALQVQIAALQAIAIPSTSPKTDQSD